MMDIYEHFDHTVIYTMENIPGPTSTDQEYGDLMDCFNSELSVQCDCLETCMPESCHCLQLSIGRNMTHEFKNNSPYHQTDSYSYPVIECNSKCSCSKTCGNRCVQNGPIRGLIIRNCGNKGLGLFTTDLINKGTFVCEYIGELLTKKQALERYNFNLIHGKMNFIFCLNEHSKDRVTQTFVDPTYIGNIGRYINHSCDPNCSIIPVRYESPIPKLAIFANKDIEADAEITFNYGAHSVSNIAFEVVNRKVCFCGSALCNGFMPYDSF